VWPTPDDSWRPNDERRARERGDIGQPSRVTLWKGGINYSIFNRLQATCSGELNTYVTSGRNHREGHSTDKEK